jgi:ribosomal protein S18 acetylase RimI-like enzyme
MNKGLALAVRRARHEDAAEVARVYIESWHDAYPGMLPMSLLGAMTPKGQTVRWQRCIQGVEGEIVLVAEHSRYGIVGLASVGAARDAALGYDGEVFSLYVDPCHYGQGAGRALLRQAFASLHDIGMTSCVIWAHSRNHARFFYEAMGGRVVAERATLLMGEKVPETAFGWKELTIGTPRAARRANLA